MSYVLTPVDIAAFRHADRLVVSFNPAAAAEHRQTSVRLIKEKQKTRRDPFAEDQVHELEGCGVKVLDRIFRDPNDAAEHKLIAFAFISLYHSQHTPESAIVHMLRAGDEIEFRFVPDHHTNGYVAAAGLHADTLELCIWRGIGRNRKHYTFEIDNGISPNNSARMIRGLPERAEYWRNGARTRRDWSPPTTIIEPPAFAATDAA